MVAGKRACAGSGVGVSPASEKRAGGAVNVYRSGGRARAMRVAREMLFCLYVLVRLPRIRLRYDVVDDHVDHRARGESQGVRQQRLDEGHGEYAHESRDRLHHAAQLTVPENRKRIRVSDGRNNNM